MAIVTRLLVLLAAFLCGAAQAQSYPNRPIKFVVPFAPGGNLDFVARSIQPKMQEVLGQPVVIENRDGAGGIVGATYAAKLPNDGYNIFLGNTGTLGIYPAVYSKLPYDPLKDFTGVGLTSINAVLLATHPSVPGSSLKDLVAHAKANPGKVAAGIAGNGSLLHFATEMLKGQAGIDLLVVPYKGSGPAATDLLGGQIQMLIDAPTVTMPHIKAGKLKAIAVSGKARLAALPDVPTFEQAGYPGMDATGWQGVAVPAGTPREAVLKLSDAVSKAINSDEVKAKFAAQGLDPASSTADELTAHMKDQVAKWTRIARQANIKVD